MIKIIFFNVLIESWDIHQNHQIGTWYMFINTLIFQVNYCKGSSFMLCHSTNVDYVYEILHLHSLYRLEYRLYWCSHWCNLSHDMLSYWKIVSRNRICVKMGSSITEILIFVQKTSIRIKPKPLYDLSWTPLISDEVSSMNYLKCLDI